MKTITKILALLAAAPWVAVEANAATLDLLGVRWNHETVTVLIRAQGQVSAAAKADVETALNDWIAALSKVPTAPTLSLLSEGKPNEADIVIHMRVGGGVILGQALPKTVSPFSCDLNQVSIQLSGKAFGNEFSSAGTQNVARHELGHALGLGHSDDEADLMFPSFEFAPIFGGDSVPISACDVQGIEDIYDAASCPAIPNSTNCPQ
jgi:predicted Zn-dependent protease